MDLPLFVIAGVFRAIHCTLLVMARETRLRESGERSSDHRSEGIQYAAAKASGTHTKVDLQ
jgi:hypothetical protein